MFSCVTSLVECLASNFVKNRKVLLHNGDPILYMLYIIECVNNYNLLG